MAVNSQQEAINYLVRKYPFIKDWNISVSESCSKNAQTDKLSWNFTVSVIEPNNSENSFHSNSENDLTEALREMDKQLKVFVLLMEKQKSEVK